MPEVKVYHNSLLLFSILIIFDQVNNMGITIVKNKEAVINKLCELIEATAQESIEKNNVFNVGVSGGSLISFLVDGLPKITTDFTKWKIFFCDERLVPVNDPDSTFGLYKKQLIDNGLISDLKENQFVTVLQGVEPEKAAESYNEEIKKYVKLNRTLPEFDLLLLGMGPDGHTCSLFPGHKLLKESHRWVTEITDSPKPPSNRITLTFPVINNAKCCIFAVSGKGKAEIIKKIHVDKEDLPAGRVLPTTGTLYWIIDENAAEFLI